MKPLNRPHIENKDWNDPLYGVTYTTKRQPRYHSFVEDYTLTRPDQPDKRLLEAYYSADAPGLPERTPDFWDEEYHKDAVLEAQFIRQGWIDEIFQSNSTPTANSRALGTTPLERSRGILAGLAIGDALGRPIEFMSKSEIKDEYGFVDSFLANGTHGQPAGTVTDDTEQALCIATSLASLGEWDPESVSEQFVDWYKSKPFDIGRTTAQSMENLAANIDWEEAGKVTQSELPGERATNGSVMRCAPLAIAYPYDTQKLIQYSLESSLITHAHPRCQYGAAILNLTLANILTFTENPLPHALDSVRGDAPDGLVSRLSSLGETSEAELSGSGDVIDTLETALYYGLTGSSFFEAVMNAVNNGGDTDTIGAITGAVAGARFGLDPTFGQNKEASVDRSLLRQTSTSGLLTLATCIHEIENGIGASHRNENWSMYASRRQTGAGQADT